jgi:hypothetical protein
MQLSLLNVAKTVANYKVGDRVKLKRKTPAAAYLKKGDIVGIAAIHPQSGSCKFWNQRTESWGYLESDEFTLLPPEIDSPTPTEGVVGESNCPFDDDCVALNAISIYRPRGTARGGEYFRLSYKDGGKVRTVHIRGGNTDSPIAQAKVAEVRSLLAAGITPAEIADMLKCKP